MATLGDGTILRALGRLLGSGVLLGEAEPATLPKCTPDQLADPQETVRAFLYNRSDLTTIYIAYTTNTISTDNFTMERFARWTMLPCDAQVGPLNPETPKRQNANTPKPLGPRASAPTPDLSPLS